MRVGVLGSGVVGKVLAAGFAGRGHEVMIGSRSPETLADWLKENPGVGSVFSATPRHAQDSSCWPSKEPRRTKCWA